jgi:tRNA wybutosine-synthesizing protein 2
MCPKNFADRVNLGLIPSSEISWKTACEALKLETGGFLHIHGNVDINSNDAKTKPKQSWLNWSEATKVRIEELLNERDQNIKWSVSVDHVEYVKSYGPRVDHLVLDLNCRPNKSQTG